MSTLPLCDQLFLLRQDMSTVPAAEALAGKKYVLLYFSAHWCPYCLDFTPKLKGFYESHSKRKNFEVVFVSLDENEEEMANYFHELHGDWLALQFSDADVMGKEWMKEYGLRGIPSLLVFERGAGDEFALVTKSARNMVEKDPEAIEFPWYDADKAAAAAVQRNIVGLLVLGALSAFGMWCAVHL